MESSKRYIALQCMGQGSAAFVDGVDDEVVRTAKLDVSGPVRLYEVTAGHGELPPGGTGKTEGRRTKKRTVRIFRTKDVSPVVES
jgi:hypothetical protein